MQKHRLTKMELQNVFKKAGKKPPKKWKTDRKQNG